MRARRKTNTFDRTHNKRNFLVTYQPPYTARPLEFHTADERQARRKAEEAAGAGWPVTIRRHDRYGVWIPIAQFNQPDGGAR